MGWRKFSVNLKALARQYGGVRRLPGLTPKPVSTTDAMTRLTGGSDGMGAATLNGRARRLDKSVDRVATFRLLAGAGRIAEAYSGYRSASLSKALKRHVPELACRDLDEAKQRVGEGKLLVLTNGGPGDELRFGAYYAEIVRRFSPAQVAFTCDPRLASMMQRAFPGVEIIPVNRLHRLWSEDNHAKLKYARHLPCLSLYRAFDDQLWMRRYDFSACINLMNALPDLEATAAETRLGPYLAADQHRVVRRLAQIGSDYQWPLVGLAWRSTFTNGARNIHYFDLTQLKPVLEEKRCTLVILQPRLTEGERAQLSTIRGKNVRFIDDVNLFDDFEELAAVLACLDASIVPATYLSEFAGALGHAGFFLTSSDQNFYRRDGKTKRDRWFPSLIHCDSGVADDKAGAVAIAAGRLSEFIDNYTKANSHDSTCLSG